MLRTHVNMLNGCSGLLIIPASEGEGMRSAEELPNEISRLVNSEFD